jgi:PilZ domain-containing protein
MITRRRWERVRVKLDVVVFDVKGEKITTGATSDICESGMGVTSPLPLEVGATQGFTVATIFPQPYKGIVRWSTPTGRGTEHHVGIEITGETRAQADALRAAVARWRAQVSKGLQP